MLIEIADVRKFLQKTKEIVFMDFHRFPHGFRGQKNNKIHKKLIKYLKEELHEFLAPDWLGRDSTPNDLWHLNRTLVLSYAHDPSAAFDEQIWSVK